jgi:lipopolysaccharide export system permease protein
MTGITRYVLRQLTVGMIFVSIALACVLWLTQSLRFVELIVSKGISVWTFLKLTLLLMPTFLVVIIPISLFAVVLFTYNKLNADRELVVLRAAGFSHWTLARPAMILAGATAALGLFMTLWLIPWAVQSFRELQWGIRNDLTSVLLQEGAFNKFGSGLTIYVRSRSPEGELLGILVHDKRNPDKPVTLMAERGALVVGPAGPRVLMLNGNRQQVPQGTGQFSVLYFDSYTVDLASTSGAGSERFRDARERTFMELINASEAELGPADYRRAKVELHQRLTSPLYSIGFTAVALAILLTAGFDRRGQTATILKAVGAMVIIQAAALGASNLATTRLSLIPLIYAAALLPIVGGCWFLLKPVRFRRNLPAAGLPA